MSLIKNLKNKLQGLKLCPPTTDLQSKQHPANFDISDLIDEMPPSKIISVPMESYVTLPYTYPIKTSKLISRHSLNSLKANEESKMQIADNNLNVLTKDGIKKDDLKIIPTDMISPNFSDMGREETEVCEALYTTKQELSEDDLKKYVLLTDEFNTMQHTYFDETTQEIKSVILHRVKYLISVDKYTSGDIGGWIESEKNLSQDGACVVKKSAKVWGEAVIENDASVSEGAVVYGTARIFGNAHITGDAQVCENSWISGNADIRGNAKITGNAFITDNAFVRDNAIVAGNAILEGAPTIKDNSIVNENAHLIGNIILMNDCHVSGDTVLEGNTSSPIKVIDSAKIDGKTHIKGYATLGGTLNLHKTHGVENMFYDIAIKSNETFNLFCEINNLDWKVPEDCNFKYVYDKKGYEKI